MNRFELTLIFKPNLSIEEIEKIMKDVENKIVENKGKIISNDTWGIREFAQPIKKQKSGYYYFLQFDLNPSKVNELKQFYLYNRDILRYLLINLTKEKTYFKQLKINELKKQEQQKLEREKEFAKAEKLDMEGFYISKNASEGEKVPQNKVVDKKPKDESSSESNAVEESTPPVNKVVDDKKPKDESSSESNAVDDKKPKDEPSSESNVDKKEKDSVKEK